MKNNSPKKVPENVNPEQISNIEPLLPTLDTKLDIDLDIVNAPAQNTQTKEIPLLINPKKIRAGDFPNRDDATYQTEAFEELRQSIALAHGNTVPILVRRIPKTVEGIEYEIVYGERRWRSCLENKLPVWANVITAEKSSSSFFETVRENQCREDLSPWEVGRQAKFALDSKLCDNQSRLAAEFGCSKSRISEGFQLAQLPAELLIAFNSPNDLQFRNAKPLTDALKKDRDAVLKAAQEIAQSDEMLKPQDIVVRLVAASEGGVRRSNNSKKEVINCHGKSIGAVLFDETGKAQIRIEQPLESKRHQALIAHLQKFYERKTIRSTPTKRVSSAEKEARQ
jgi:ParB family chromosome partitioning protein